MVSRITYTCNKHVHKNQVMCVNAAQFVIKCFSEITVDSLSYHSALGKAMIAITLIIVFYRSPFITLEQSLCIRKLFVSNPYVSESCL